MNEIERLKSIDVNGAIAQALREQAEREKGCDLCMPVNTMKSMGAYGRKFTYCPMCGKRLEEHHEAD